MEERRRLGYRVVATVTDVKGKCTWNHKVGDMFDISCHDTAGLCGFFYHDIFPALSMLQFGGAYGWGNEDAVTVECLDRHNAVKMELKRMREPGM